MSALEELATREIMSAFPQTDAPHLAPAWAVLAGARHLRHLENPPPAIAAALNEVDEE